MKSRLRVGELCALETGAVVQIGDGWWLRVPLGKLHNDRYVPLLPQLLGLLDAWKATSCSPPTTTRPSRDPRHQGPPVGHT